MQPLSKKHAGFTLIELMVTIAIVAILASIAVPNLGIWIKRNQLVNTAESIQNGLRMAQAEAIRRNTTVQFLLTDATPSATATPLSTGRNWAVRLSSATGVAPADGFISGFTNEAGAGPTVGAILASSAPFPGLGSLVFNSYGRVLNPATGAVLANNAMVQIEVTGAKRRLCVYVSPAGSVRTCDPMVDATNSMSCVALPVGACSTAAPL